MLLNVKGGLPVDFKACKKIKKTVAFSIDFVRNGRGCCGGDAVYRLLPQRLFF